MHDSHEEGGKRERSAGPLPAGRIEALPSRVSSMAPSIRVIILLAMTGGVAYTDLVTGYEIAFSLFYLVPVGFAAWFMGRTWSVLASVLSSLLWLWFDLASGHTYSHSAIPLWNSAVRLSFFLIVALSLGRIRLALEIEQLHSSTDGLTGLSNHRWFNAIVASEVWRARRYGHPLSFCYFDLDNFKQINDTQGHAGGDEVLKTVADVMRRRLRAGDVSARLGGDEFAFLLPETGHAAAEKVVMDLRLRLLAAMEERGWPVTFTFGLVGFAVPPESVDELIRLADDLMYEGKQAGKNRVSVRAVDDPGEDVPVSRRD